jgi:DNA-binding IclR family transcriptional regulator
MADAKDVPRTDSAVSALALVEDGSERDRRSYAVPAAEKTLDILEYMTGVAQGVTATELASALGRSVHEIYRVIQVLEARGYLYRPSSSDRYRISLKLFELAHRLPPVRQLTDAALPVMQALTPRTQQSCHLVVLSGTEVMIALQIDSPLPMRYSVTLGAKFAFESTSSGLVIYSYLPDPSRLALDEALRAAGRSKRDVASVHRRREKIRDEGHEVMPSLQVAGITNISVPVFDYLGHAVGALTVPYLPQEAATISVEDVTQLCRHAGDAISRELGAGRAPEGPLSSRKSDAKST